MSALALCIVEAGRTTVIAAAAFTLSWTHSVERVRWEEDWRIGADGLRVVEARVAGSGAGMEPLEGSMLSDGWWRYRPVLPAQAEVRLAASGATGSGWHLCAGGSCRDVGAVAGEPVILKACGDEAR